MFSNMYPAPAVFALLHRLRTALHRPIARRSLNNLAIKVVSIPIALAVNAVLARILTIEDFGTYGVVLSIFLMFSMPVIYALSDLSIREVGSNLGAGARDKAAGVMRYGLAMMAFFSVGYAISILLLQVVPMPKGYQVSVGTLIYTLALYPLFLLTSVGGAQLRAMHRVELGILPEQLLRQVFFLLLLPVAYFGIDAPLNASWAFSVQSLAMLFSAAFAMLMVWRTARESIGQTRPQIEWRVWNSSLVPFLMLGLVQTGNSQMGMVVLGAFDMKEDAAYYRVAELLSGLATLPLLAVNMTMGPLVSKLRGSGERAGIQTSLAASGKLIALLTLPALALLCLFPGPLLALLFGEPYRQAASLLVILCIGMAFNAILGPVGLTLNMLGHERETLRGMWVALAVNVVLALALIPWLGALGAALASATSKIVWNILLFRCLYQLEGYSTLPFLVKPRLPTP